MGTKWLAAYGINWKDIIFLGHCEIFMIVCFALSMSFFISRPLTNLECHSEICEAGLLICDMTTISYPFYNNRVLERENYSNLGVDIEGL